MAPWIISHFPVHRIYVEPYGGAGSVLMRKPRSYAEIFNDLDSELFNLFVTLRDQGYERLEYLLTNTPYSREEYYAAMEPCRDQLENARRLIVRSYMGYSSDAFNIKRRSGFRSDGKRRGSTPQQDWMNYPRYLKEFAQRLRGVIIENKPALELIEQHDGPQSLFYCDPPYPHSTRSRKSHSIASYKYEMTDAEHIELAERLQRIKGMAIVSSYPCPLYFELYKNWRFEEKKTCVGGVCSDRTRTEVLWLSPNISKQSDLFQ